MREQGKTKDEAAATRLKAVTKAVIPLPNVFDKVDAAHKAVEKKKLKEAKDLITDIDDLVQKAYGILDYFVTDGTRKRKYAACASLGKNFSAFAGVKEESVHNEFLFGDEAMKKMKPELKKLPLIGSSKNGKGAFKTSRGQFSGGYSNYNPHHSNSYQSNSHQNQQHYTPRQGQGNRQQSHRGNRGNGGNSRGRWRGR